MPKIDGTGMVITGVAWIAIMAGVINKMACMKLHTCDGGDLFLLCFIAVGMIAPAWFAGALFSKD